MATWDGPTDVVEQCLSRIRWKGDVLQQQWCITTVTAGNGSFGLRIGEQFEWRDVPRDQEDEEGQE